MSLTAWSETFAQGRDEDEILLEWLRYSLPHLSAADKRVAVRRLCGEFGYTITGLASFLGLSYSTVHNYNMSDEACERARSSRRLRQRSQPRVSRTRVLRFAERWQERAAEGLSAKESLLLLEELRALVPDGKAKA